MWMASAGEIGEPNWLPDDGRAVVYLRVAGRGSLADLERRFNGEAVDTFAELQLAVIDDSDRKAQRAARQRLREEFPDGVPTQLRPEFTLYRGYAPASVESDEVAVPGTVLDPHLIVRILERVDGPYRHLDLVAVLSVTQRWREAILSQSNDAPEHIRELLSGHERSQAPLDRPHLAFVPLAFAGHPHADGRLLGMGLTLPRGLSPADRRAALRVIGRVNQLVLGRLGVWRLAADTSSQPVWNLRPATWTSHPEGATHWSTVTPVAFDRHPKSKDRASYQRELAAMIAESCVRMGLPEPREAIVTSVSAHLGVPPSHAFPRLKRKDGSERRHAHAILVFGERVCGPVVIGAGRYRGYGVARGISEKGAQP
jgi:CRISPR-associated protein Csb2